MDMMHKLGMDSLSEDAMLKGYLRVIGLPKLADSLEYYRELSIPTLSSVFGVPAQVLKACEVGSDDMLRVAEDRALLNAAFQEAPMIFDEPMTTVTELCIRYHYLSERPYFCETTYGGSTLLHTVQYLNNICKSDEDAYTKFSLFQNYVTYCIRIGKAIDGLYPDDLEKAVTEAIDILNEKYETEKMLRFRKVTWSFPDWKEDLSESPYAFVVPEEKTELTQYNRTFHMCFTRYFLSEDPRSDRIVFIRSKESKSVIGYIVLKAGNNPDAEGEALSYFVDRICCPYEEEVYPFVKSWAERKNIRVKMEQGQTSER